ncbi:hypothetical protein ACI01nite_03670 [Acetobacter cibinongensis]|uniref:Glycosyl transferase family 2 n=1 Tax=Acetobacter cibinongensis TaxID=146475 RepID=A0A0D6N771_9PROT|nr:glycosyltransferase family 2 protein [Acetobacter cibinongensis]GAN61341.1 hypothetical protein Abci_018_211 [Acetobacter cibinongensis]GBQ16955.1 hypothetical protein AA0482_1740 [Acetobacter cibinongensis NRIC 0482]GEL57765.1 hypothetical protein ACI01nite_03670 [Acetobacter cibinongensis]
MLDIRCIAMQKNEGKNLEAWIKYHAYLFGIENIYILDNGSDDEETILILEKFEMIGCNVDKQYTGSNAFESKGNIINEIIRAWDEQDTYDFAIPLDVDEFIILFDENLSCRKKKIHDYFLYLKKTKQDQAFIMQNMLLNIPNEPGFFYPATVPKCFFRKNTIGLLDHGFHHPIAKHSNTPYYTQLGYVHLHNKPFDKLINSATRKLSHLVNLDDKESLKNYSGHGEHLVKYFFMTKKDYEKLYTEKGNIYFPSIMKIFELLSVDIKSIFGNNFTNIELPKLQTFFIRYPSVDNDTLYYFGFFNKYQYLNRNHDIKNANIDPLMHFCSLGYKEYRPLNDSDSKIALEKSDTNTNNFRLIEKEIRHLNFY